MSADHDLDGAYSLKTPEDSVRYYRDWATKYDTEFAKDYGYVFPGALAETYAGIAGAEEAPVLDVGAGTGLVAQELRARGVTAEIDGIDISTEMLAVARAKGIYRDAIEADLTATLPMADGAYGALVASGVFTHGHVGPVCLPELVRVTRPGALWCIGIHPGVFDSAGFGSAFARLVAEGRITPVDFRAVRIYEGKEHEHSGDDAFLAIFRRR